MTYRIELVSSSTGYLAACPDIPGCTSHGETTEEAMRNIRLAISQCRSVASSEVHRQVPAREVRYVDLPDAEAETALQPFKVTPISMSLPHFVRADDLLDELEGVCRR